MRAVLVRLSSIGDVVHTLPALAVLSRGGWTCGWLVEPAARPLMEGNAKRVSLFWIDCDGENQLQGTNWRLRFPCTLTRHQDCVKPGSCLFFELEKIDDHTVRFKLNNPNGSFLDAIFNLWLTRSTNGKRRGGKANSKRRCS